MIDINTMEALPLFPSIYFMDLNIYQGLSSILIKLLYIGLDW